MDKMRFLKKDRLTALHMFYSLNILSPSCRKQILSSGRNLRVGARYFQSDSVPRPPACSLCAPYLLWRLVCLCVCLFIFYPVKSSVVTGHVGWRESRGWREFLVLRVPGSGTLLQPRAARAQVPQEAPGVLRGDGCREMFPHVQRKKLTLFMFVCLCICVYNACLHVSVLPCVSSDGFRTACQHQLSVRIDWSESFVWKNKIYYIKRSTLMHSHEDGGFKFLDFSTFNNTFKINWIRNPTSVWNFIPNYIFSKIGVLNFLLFCTYIIEQLPTKLANFHKQILLSLSLIYKQNFTPHRYLNLE